jgi:hypothetical protein
MCNNGHVELISLVYNTLSGTVPDLSPLTQLTLLNLSNNDLDYIPTDCHQVKQIPKEECETLVTLYNATNGMVLFLT